MQTIINMRRRKAYEPISIHKSLTYFHSSVSLTIIFMLKYVQKAIVPTIDKIKKTIPPFSLDSSEHLKVILSSINASNANDTK